MFGAKGTARLGAVRGVFGFIKKSFYVVSPVVVRSIVEGQEIVFGSFLLDPFAKGEFASSPGPFLSPRIPRPAQAREPSPYRDNIRGHSPRKLLRYLRLPVLLSRISRIIQSMSIFDRRFVVLSLIKSSEPHLDKLRLDIRCNRCSRTELSVSMPVVRVWFGFRFSYRLPGFWFVFPS